MFLTIEEIKELKKELILSYKSENIYNCIGSVEKVVDELFELRDKHNHDKSNDLKNKMLESWNKNVRNTRKI